MINKTKIYIEKLVLAVPSNSQRDFEINSCFFFSRVLFFLIAFLTDI